MLRLRQQVLRQPRGIGAGIGEDEHLGGPGDGVDAALADELALGLGHEAVPRPGHEIHLRRVVGQKAHALRAAARVELVEAELLGGGQHQRIDAERALQRGLRPRRRDPDDARGARHLRGDHGHGQRRGVEGAAAGHVHPNALDGHPALAHRAAAGKRELHVGERLTLGLGKATDPRGHLLEGREQCRVRTRDLRVRAREHLCREPHAFGRHVDAIVLAGEPRHRRAPFATDGVEDSCDGGGGLEIARGLAHQGADGGGNVSQLSGRDEATPGWLRGSRRNLADSTRRVTTRRGSAYFAATHAPYAASAVRNAVSSLAQTVSPPSALAQLKARQSKKVLAASLTCADASQAGST